MSLGHKILLKITDILTGYVQAFVVIITTVGYIGMLFLCLLYATTPVYQNDFEILLKTSFIPGFIWGAYATTKIIQQSQKSKEFDET